MNYKKAIYPVVATALLLVVAVVAVVGFQTFFNTYSTGLFSKVETQSTSQVGNTQIENLIGNSLYFKNSNTENITITSVKVDDVDCSYSGNASPGISEINVTSCISNISTSTPEVVIYTSNGIYSKKFYVNNIISTNTPQISALNCSALGLAGGTWITVPGNVALGTSDFCVMKFEAKNVGGVATSQAASSPWVSINQNNARNNCTALGINYHLITNAQWTSIARNIEQVSTNWANNIIGSTVASGGGLKRGNVGITDSASYDGANPADRSIDTNTKALLNLSNGESIWDLSGNVWEWNNDTCSQGDPWFNSGWREWNHSDVNGPEKTLAGPLGNYGSLNGMGLYYGCSTAGNGLLRGANWNYGASAGAFMLSFGSVPSDADTGIGFRCSYAP